MRGPDTKAVVTLVSPEGDAAREAVQLLHEVFGTPQPTSASWAWKYRDNYFGPSILVGAGPDNSGGESLAGFRAFWRWRLWWRGGEVEAAQPCDTAVASAHRRRGLFAAMNRRALAEAEKMGIRVLFNNPNPEAARGYLKTGWRDLGGLRWHARLVRPGRVLAAIPRWRGRVPTAVWTSPSSCWSQEEDRDRLVTFLERCRREHPGTWWTARSPEYYRWRYRAAPQRAYGAVAWPPGPAELEVLIVYGMAVRGGLREAQIMDVLASPPSGEALRPALEEVRRRERPDWMVTAVGSGFPFLGLLRRCGFRRLPRTAALVGRGIRPGDGEELVPARMGIVLGDLDTF